MIPYLDETAPYVEGVSGGETVQGLAAVYRSLEKRDQFRNLIRTNRLFKDAQLSVYRASLARVIGIRERVANELDATTGDSS
jgi:hypothetical protein